MALIARFLIDTSSAARMPLPHVAARLAPLIEGGLVATTAVLDSEALYSARSSVEDEQLWRTGGSPMSIYPPTMSNGARRSTRSDSWPGKAATELSVCLTC